MSIDEDANAPWPVDASVSSFFGVSFLLLRNHFIAKKDQQWIETYVIEFPVSCSIQQKSNCNPVPVPIYF
ncbi:hypothetical protein T08_12894 [Trichinella sp. T8]|nr:hypothetical protein T08_12894 [Trichinella sp. T8]